MPTTEICFSKAKSRIKDILRLERVHLPRSYFGLLVNFLSKAYIYEEEGRKLRPSIIIGNGLIEKDILKMISHNYILPVRKGKRDGSDIEKSIKSLIPFCENNWYIYIDIGEEIEYGVCRIYSGLQGLSLSEVLLANLSDHFTRELVGSAVIIDIISKFELKFSGIRGNDLVIDFRFSSEEHSSAHDIYNELSKDMVSNIDDVKNKEVLSKVYNNLMRLASHKSHGSICVIIKNEITCPIDFLSDGIWLKNPIDLSESALDVLSESNDVYINEKYYSLTGLLFEMLNLDGITVIDNKGHIRGYNIFIRSDVKSKKHIVGGARKRAAYSILESRCESIIGVFFQSQDGMMFYERMNANA